MTVTGAGGFPFESSPDRLAEAEDVAADVGDAAALGAGSVVGDDLDGIDA